MKAKKILRDNMIIFLSSAAVGLLSLLLGLVIGYVMSDSAHGTRSDVLMIETNAGFPLLVNAYDKENWTEMQKQGYGAHIRNLLRKIVKEGDVCFDISGGYGYYSVLLSRLVGERGRVFSFEAIPEIYKLLKYSVHMNDLENVKTYDMLAYSTDAEIVLKVDPKHMTRGSLVKEGNTEGGIKVHAASLDSIFPNLSNVALIMINTNGAELQAIRGAAQIIGRSGHISIILPWRHEDFESSGDVYSKLIDNFIDAGFEFWLIGGDGGLKLMQKTHLLTLKSGNILITKHTIS